MSSGWPMRPQGIFSSSLGSSCGLLQTSRLIGVAMAPGATPTTRIFLSASATAMHLVSIERPALLAQ